MFKVRYIFITVVISIAGMMMFDMQQDLNRINNALENVQYTVQTAVDAGLDLAMTSEDFFTLERDEEHYVTSMSEDDFKVTYWNDGNWDRCNIFAAAAYYQNHGELADEGTMLNECASESAAFRYMYNKDVDPDFKNYYDEVGSSVMSSVWLFEAVDGEADDIDATGTVKTVAGKSVQVPVPLLARMGTESLGLTSDYDAYKDPNNVIRYSLKRGYENSYYRQTPYSLGLCYLKPAVVKVLVMSNLQQLMRYEYGNEYGDWVLGTGCMETKVHPFNRAVPVPHSGESDDIVNNGKFEVNPNDVTFDIEYYSMDLYDPKNAEIASLLYGASTPAMGGRPDDYWANISKLKEKDTGNTDYGDNTVKVAGGNATKQTVVAKVTAHVPIHVPYTSPILQWAAYLRGDTDHFGIKSLGVDGTASDSDDLTYDYTTWVGIAR
mgnify:CR=1 FL=1